MPKGKLVLLPNLLSYHKDWQKELPIVTQERVAILDGLICESEKAARRFLAHFREKLPRAVNQYPIAVMSKPITKKDLSFYFEPINQGENWGLVVDSGLPCIADPGSKCVAFAYQQGIQVETIPGPSAVLIALQLSGFYAQQFHFLGYLPTELKSRVATLRKLGAQAANCVQLFIETPYRNEQTLKDLIQYLPSHLQVCIVCNLSMEGEKVIRQSLANLQKNLPELKKQQCLFLVSG